MKKKDKICIDYALHAYDIFWDYYKKTLDERNKIINNYIVFVGIPISIIGIVYEKIKDIISAYSELIAWGFVFIFLFGIVFYEAYVVESIVSEKYLCKIEEITQFLIQNYDKKFRNVFSNTYSLDNLFLNSKKSQRHKLRKSFIFIVVNTSIFICIAFLFQNKVKSFSAIMFAIFSILIHIAIFMKHKR